MTQFLKITSIQFILVILMFLSLEGLCFLLLNSGERPGGFLFSTSNFQSRFARASDNLLALGFFDPLLGWSYDPKSSYVNNSDSILNGYRIHGNPDTATIRILITGGSTSETFVHQNSWPGKIYELLTTAGHKVVIYNGAIPSYTSYQEYLKVARDGTALKPHIHISYSGANEVQEAEDTRKTPPYITYLYGQLLNGSPPVILPNTWSFLGKITMRSRTGIIRGINHGFEKPKELGLNWLENLRKMNSLAREFDYKFMAIIQPVLGIGRYNMSENEKVIAKESNVPQKYNEYYPYLIDRIKNHDFIADKTNIFSGQSNIYTDDCHITSEGNQIVAEKLLPLFEGLIAEVNTEKM